MSNAAAAAKPAAAPPAPARPSRMTLQAVTRGKVSSPYRLLVYGVDGVGKSTFGSDAPAPVFLGTEDGTDHLEVARFPVPQSWSEVLEAVRTLTADPGDFKTLVLDSLDWAEPLLWRDVCANAGVTTIEEVGGGYGKGYTAAVDGWRVLLAALERLQRERGLHVVLLAHSIIKAFKNPEGEDFDRHILALNEKAAGVLRQWCSGVYFANYETFAVKDKAKRVRGVSTGARLLYTQRTAAYDAKDRYGVPESVPLAWADFEAAAKAQAPADPEVLTAEVKRKAAELGGEGEKQTLAALVRAGRDAVKLSQLNSWVNAKLAAKAEKEKP